MGLNKKVVVIGGNSGYTHINPVSTKRLADLLSTYVHGKLFDNFNYDPIGGLLAVKERMREFNTKADVYYRLHVAAGSKIIEYHLSESGLTQAMIKNTNLSRRRTKQRARRLTAACTHVCYCDVVYKPEATVSHITIDLTLGGT